MVTEHRFTIDDGDPYFVTGPVHLAGFTMRAGDFAISADDFRGAELRPGDAITVEMAGGKMRIMRTRQRPWWRRWPWARTERTVLREFDWQRRPRQGGRDAPMPPRPQLPIAPTLGEMLASISHRCPSCGTEHALRRPLGTVSGRRYTIDGDLCRTVWVRTIFGDQHTVWCAPCWLDAGAPTVIDQVPSFYRRPLPALPWGDSAYTSIRFPRWLPDDPALDRDTGWMYGPPSNGLTPSSEGPRRAAEALTRALRKQYERWDRERRPRWETAIGDRPWNIPSHLPFEAGARVGWQDEHGVIHSGTVDDHHPIGSDGWEMHVTWDRDEDR
ncbi:hypothetical protein [Nocardia abscessus]|uniref:hypothetical protein n=1 Tax=Nocardia abscessus TaxID=120957 RepID=UPI0024545E0D|nr:hypothetical protein [Nocardia abscessus]